MSSENRYTDYDTWAWLYNKTMGPQYSEKQLSLLEKLLLPHLPKGVQILDLCCGDVVAQSVIQFVQALTRGTVVDFGMLLDPQVHHSLQTPDFIRQGVNVGLAFRGFGF